VPQDLSGEEALNEARTRYGASGLSAHLDQFYDAVRLHSTSLSLDTLQYYDLIWEYDEVSNNFAFQVHFERSLAYNVASLTPTISLSITGWV
jgi:hypothetical protein